MNLSLVSPFVYLASEKISAENLSDFITERYVILNKSGDADELECVVKEPYIQEILDIILKHFKSNK